MISRKNRRTKRDVALDVLEQSGSESIGNDELNLIQQKLIENFGLGAVESPARLARTLADLGVPLRHPEILDADSAWRESQLAKLPNAKDLNFETVQSALNSMLKLEEFRKRYEAEGGKEIWQSVVAHARETKLELGRVNSELARELVQWLRIWLQNPEIFADWVSLRQRSPEFLRRFGPIS